MVAQEKLREPEGQSLFSDARGPVKKQCRGKGMAAVGPGERLTGRCVTPEVVQAHDCVPGKACAADGRRVTQERGL